MDFTYDTNGTPRQIGWAQEAVNQCGYDLSLLDVRVRVTWESPLPISSDIGHLHSYMVTESGGGQDFDYTIFITTWADDAGNPNNSGLPDPANDIYDFYKQSFVHELGHVVTFATIDSDSASQTHAASLYWTPDTSGGSGRRYGTLADWDVDVWAQNMKEAIAETFKCVYYPGRLIYLNRTIWHLDPQSWVELWTMLLPPYKTLWQDTHAEAILKSGGVPDLSSPTEIGISYLQKAHAVFSLGPATNIPPYVIGSPDPDPGGTYHFHLTVSNFDPATPDQQALLAGVQIDGARNDLPPFGPDDFCLVSMAIQATNVMGNAEGDLDAPSKLEILLAPGLNPNEVSVQLFGCGISAEGTAVVPAGHDHLQVALTGQTGGEIEVNAGSVAWVATFAPFPPPFPFGTANGDVGVGAGLRGAVILGES